MREQDYLVLIKIVDREITMIQNILLEVYSIDEIDDTYIRVLENLKTKLMRAYKESCKK